MIKTILFGSHVKGYDYGISKNASISGSLSKSGCVSMRSKKRTILGLLIVV